MEKRLTKNLWLKIISVFLAFFIWLAVVNISDPEVTASKEVTLEILNESVLTESDLTYELLMDKSTVTVTYKVRTTNANSVQASDFRAYIDLAEMYEPTGAVQVKVDSYNNKVDSPQPRPAVVRVSTEDLQQKRFDLSVFIEGNTEDNYQQGTASVTPSYVYVSGPMSLVGQISTVGIVVDIENATSDISGTARIKCFDANRNEITLDSRVSLSREQASYSIPILRVKNLPLNFVTQGTVAEGYCYTGIESSRNSVSVMGLKSDLADITYVTIPGDVLDLDGATGDRTVTVDVQDYLPEGIELAGESGEVEVTMKVEPLEERDYEMDTDLIMLEGEEEDYSYTFTTGSIRVVIRGLSEDLDALDEDDLTAVLDVSGEKPGRSVLDPEFDLGSAYEVVSYEMVRLDIVDEAARATLEAERGVQEDVDSGPGVQATDRGETLP